MCILLYFLHLCADVTSPYTEIYTPSSRSITTNVHSIYGYVSLYSSYDSQRTIIAQRKNIWGEGKWMNSKACEYNGTVCCCEYVVFFCIYLFGKGKMYTFSSTRVPPVQWVKKQLYTTTPHMDTVYVFDCCTFFYSRLGE
jgi:hypothetical protein